MSASSLISLSPPTRRLDRALLEAPGGFLWWYVDLVEPDGNGLVLIWSYGLPFLPGYAQAARDGRAPEPGQRPSVNLSIYKDGALDFYLLQELEPDQAVWSSAEDTWRFGDCRMRRQIVDDRVELDIDIDCPIGGADDRLIGRIELDGVHREPCTTHDRLDDGAPAEHLGHHDWTPITGPARGVAELTHGDQRWQIEGRAYHDRNGGSIPQHDLGIDHWIWGRVPLADRELIYYLLWTERDGAPDCFGLSIDDDGRTQLIDDLQVERGRAHRNLGGLRWWPQLEISCAGQPWLSVRHRDVVDSGPFYMRYLTEVTVPGNQPVRGFGELCEPARVDLARHRPLVRMRTHDLGGRNSIWLPLFTGPKTGRVRRLIGSWLGGGRS
jgi:hypothetical protein